MGQQIKTKYETRIGSLSSSCVCLTSLAADINW